MIPSECAGIASVSARSARHSVDQITRRSAEVSRRSSTRPNRRSWVSGFVLYRRREMSDRGAPAATSAADTSITARVKSALVQAQDLQANVIKVITESGVVYMMGLVSRREADRAAQVASRVSGVQRVVTVFEFISEEDVKRASQQKQ